MDNTTILAIVLTLVYCVLGGGVYRLCRSSNLGSLDEAPIVVIFLWPLLLVISIFAEE